VKAFDAVRRVTVFLLGVVVIINALVNPEERLGQLAIGMVMVGVLPVESLTFWKSNGDRETISQGGPTPPDYSSSSDP
jgi:hypothetical protein